MTVPDQKSHLALRILLLENKGATARFMIFAAAGAVLEVGVAFVFRQLAEDVTRIPTLGMDVLLRHLGLSTLYLIPCFFSDLLLQSQTYKVAHSFGAYLRGSVISQFFTDQANIAERQTLVAHAVSDVDTLEEEYAVAVLSIIRQGILLATALIATASISWSAAAPILLLSILQAFLPSIFSQKLLALQNRAVQLREQMVEHVAELANSSVHITLTGNSSRYASATISGIGSLRQAKDELTTFRSAIWALSWASGTLLIILSWGLGAIAVYAGHITIASVVALAHLSTIIAGPVQQIAERYSESISTRGLRTQRLSSQSDSSGGRESWSGTEVLNASSGDLTQSYSYTFCSGDRVLLSGDSGSGKSTLIRFLVGASLPEHGSVIFRGTEGGMSPLSLQGSVSFIEQTPSIVTGTVRQVVTEFSSHELDEDRLSSYLSASRLEELWGADGSRMISAKTISGGEARRLEIVRTCMSRRPVVIMDEPFAGIDTETVLALLDLMVDDFRNRTVLITSHLLAAEIAAKLDLSTVAVSSLVDRK